jgi:hypothetical protein
VTNRRSPYKRDPEIFLSTTPLSNQRPPHQKDSVRHRRQPPISFLVSFFGDVIRYNETLHPLFPSSTREIRP